MRRWTFRSTACVLLLLALALLGGRTLWLASRTETGLGVFRQQWRDATIGLAFGPHVPVQLHDSAVQAKFWLAETSEVTQRYPDHADLAAGAAMLLSAPVQPDYRSYLVEVMTLPGSGTFPSFEQHQLYFDAYRNRCSRQCLNLAARATQLDSTNAQWWRLRAWLLWQQPMGPLDPDFLAVLDEGARSDPDNALYDYLAAVAYWRSSAEWDPESSGFTLIVRDAIQFEQGVQCIELGQAKRFFAAGYAAPAVTHRRLNHTRLALAEHPPIVSSRSQDWANPLHAIIRWQSARANTISASGEVRAALDVHHQSLHALDQSAQGDDSPFLAHWLRPLVTVGMRDLAIDEGNQISENEQQEIDDLRKEAALNHQAFRTAAQDLANRPDQRSLYEAVIRNPIEVIQALVVRVFPGLAVSLAMIGLVASTLSWRFDAADAARLGLVEQVVSVMAAFTLSAVVFGLAPALIIGREAQHWLATVIIVLAILGLIVRVALTRMRRRAFRFTLRSMFISMFILSVLMGLQTIFGPVIRSPLHIPFDLDLPARSSWSTVYRNVGTIAEYNGGWLWAAFQWCAYYGQYWTIAFWAALVAILLALKLRSVHKSEGVERICRRDRARAIFRALGPPSLVGSAIVLLAYFAALPGVLDAIEQDFQSNMAIVHQPQEYQARIDQAIAEARAKLNGD